MRKNWIRVILYTKSGREHSFQTAGCKSNPRAFGPRVGLQPKVWNECFHSLLVYRIVNSIFKSIFSIYQLFLEITSRYIIFCKTFENTKKLLQLAISLPSFVPGTPSTHQIKVKTILHIMVSSYFPKNNF